MILVFDINEFPLCLFKIDLINTKAKMIMKAGQTHYYLNFPLSLPLPPFFVNWVFHLVDVIILFSIKGGFYITSLPLD